MRYFNHHFHSLIRRDDDSALLIGIAGGRVPHDPYAKWLYSLRIFFLVFRVEILWTTGEVNDQIATL